MKKIKTPNMDGGDFRIINDDPCVSLWLAVAERAIIDYCHFFDHWTTIANRYVDFNRKPTNYFAATKRLELAALHKFVFEETVNKHNLTWIFEECFRGDDSLLNSIRNEIAKKHEANLYKHRTHPVLASVVATYENAGGLKAIDDVEPLPKIRWRAKLH